MNVLNLNSMIGIEKYLVVIIMYRYMFFPSLLTIFLLTFESILAAVIF